MRGMCLGIRRIFYLSSVSLWHIGKEGALLLSFFHVVVSMDVHRRDFILVLSLSSYRFFYISVHRKQISLFAFSLLMFML